MAAIVDSSHPVSPSVFTTGDIKLRSKLYYSFVKFALILNRSSVISSELASC